MRNRHGKGQVTQRAANPSDADNIYIPITADDRTKHNNKTVRVKSAVKAKRKAQRASRKKNR